MKMSVTAVEEGKMKDANHSVVLAKQLEQEMKSPLGELKAQALTHIKNKDFGEKSLLCPSLLFLSILKVGGVDVDMIMFLCRVPKYKSMCYK
jgi:hypothetical protein